MAASLAGGGLLWLGGDESMIDGLMYYGGMYLYRHDRSNLVLICYNPILSIRNSNNSKPNLLHDRSNLVFVCYNSILSISNSNKLGTKSITL
jgi:hypothetical protein